MDDDIDGFQTMLAGYKATFNIALADANLYVLLLSLNSDVTVGHAFSVGLRLSVANPLSTPKS
jgi:hypothetical protein